MEYCVCQNKDGYLFLQSRQERESMLSVLLDINEDIPTRVIAVFDDMADAEDFIRNVNNGDEILKKIT